MLNQVNLNTNNAFTSEMQKTTPTKPNEPSGNLLHIADDSFDTVEIQKKTPKKETKPTPLWLKAIYSTLFTTAAILSVGFISTKLGYTPIKSDTKGLFNSRTTEFKNGAKDAIGGISSVMTLNSHCGKKSLEQLPSTHQGLIVMLDKEGKQGIQTLAQSKFKDNIIYGGELKLKELKEYSKLKEYVKKIAQQIHKKENYENITFASENARSANMINAVLQCHGEGKKASTSDFVEGGIPSHYFWGKNGIASDKLDNAVWEGWCEGFGIKLNEESEVKEEKKEEIKEEEKEEIKEEKKEEVKKEKEDEIKKDKTTDLTYLFNKGQLFNKKFLEITSKPVFLESLTTDAKNVLYELCNMNIQNEKTSFTISKDNGLKSKESITIKQIKWGDHCYLDITLYKRWRWGRSPNMTITLDDLKPKPETNK